MLSALSRFDTFGLAVGDELQAAVHELRRATSILSSRHRLFGTQVDG